MQQRHAPPTFQLTQRHPGQEADVRRNQRQHAGGEKAQEAGGERHRDAQCRGLVHPALRRGHDQLPPEAVAADAVDLHPVARVLEGVLVGDARQHPLEPLVLELDHVAAPLADQVLVVRLRRHRLVALEAFAEVVRPHEAALHQHLERAVDGGGADGFVTLSQAADDGVHRGMVFGEEDDLGDEVALAGDRQAVIAEVAAETVEERGSLRPSEGGHRRPRRASPRGTRSPATPAWAAARRRSACGCPAAAARAR